MFSTVNCWGTMPVCVKNAWLRQLQSSAKPCARGASDGRTPPTGCTSWVDRALSVWRNFSAASFLGRSCRTAPDLLRCTTVLLNPAAMPVGPSLTSHVRWHYRGVQSMSRPRSWRDGRWLLPALSASSNTTEKVSLTYMEQTRLMARKKGGMGTLNTQRCPVSERGPGRADETHLDRPRDRPQIDATPKLPNSRSVASPDRKREPDTRTQACSPIEPDDYGPPR